MIYLLFEAISLLVRMTEIFVQKYLLDGSSRALERKVIIAFQPFSILLWNSFLLHILFCSTILPSWWFTLLESSCNIVSYLNTSNYGGAMVGHGRGVLKWYLEKPEDKTSLWESLWAQTLCQFVHILQAMLLCNHRLMLCRYNSMQNIYDFNKLCVRH